MIVKGCGTWPALWTYNSEWPTKGEIDIIEGANSQKSNQVTLHTGPTCSMTQGETVDGTELTEANCNDGSGGLGCPQTTNSTNNFGKGLNAAGGGIYAMEWTSDAISVWFFPRNSTMQNKISSSNTTVDSSMFGTPLASFVGGSSCDIDNNFKEHWITINTDFVSTSSYPNVTAPSWRFANNKFIVWSMGRRNMGHRCRVQGKGTHLRGIRSSGPQCLRRRIL